MVSISKLLGRMEWRDSLRHCATIRKVAGSIPDGLRVDSASNRKEYHKYFLWRKGVGLTNLPPLCVDCLEIWEPQTPGTLKAFFGVHRNCFTFRCLRNKLLTFILSHPPHFAFTFSDDCKESRWGRCIISRAPTRRGAGSGWHYTTERARDITRRLLRV
jgi:hypothetical protein